MISLATESEIGLPLYFWPSKGRCCWGFSPTQSKNKRLNVIGHVEGPNAIYRFSKQFGCRINQCQSLSFQRPPEKRAVFRVDNLHLHSNHSDRSMVLSNDFTSQSAIIFIYYHYILQRQTKQIKLHRLRNQIHQGSVIESWLGDKSEFHRQIEWMRLLSVRTNSQRPRLGGLLRLSLDLLDERRRDSVAMAACANRARFFGESNNRTGITFRELWHCGHDGTICESRTVGLAHSECEKDCRNMHKWPAIESAA
jgi:hypothetical protein